MRHIARSTLIVAIFFGLEKGLGFLRQVLIARQFGLSAELDAYNAANNLPDLLFSLISGGALAIALIPVLSECLQKSGRPQAWALFSQIANLVFLITAALSLVVAVFAGRLVGWQIGIAPGFTPEQQVLVTSLMRYNLLATLLFSLSGLVMAGLQANQHFLLPALAPSMYDLGSLFGVLVLVPEKGYRLAGLTLPAFGLGIHGLVYGVIIGAALFLAIQIPGLARYQFHWSASIHLRNPRVRQVLTLMGPRVVNVFFIQLIFLAQDNIASRLAPGAVTALVYGWLFMQVPETLIGTAIGTVLLPTLSEQIARQDRQAFSRSLNYSLRLVLALCLPGAVLLAVIIRSLVGILDFTTAGTDLVVWTSLAFLLGLAGHAMLEIAVRAFYAQQNARIPLVAAGAATAIFIGLAVLFAPWLGPAGIALANTIAITGEALVMWGLLNRKFSGILAVGKTLWRAALASVICAGMAALFMLISMPPILSAAGAAVLGGLAVIPFIRTEIQLLLKL